ncbi:Mll7437 protein [hydrothermal vent metagenome]|uniref:Mll7437 protein n=1 Tax=hydrothermal vent metagenome TaxID=652676 RepID=A0A1W1EJC8_9ZZZZ
MKKLLLIFILLGLNFLYAQNPREIYMARISENDKYNSRGMRLNSVAAIIRQDRANYHKFYIRDRGDSTDDFFSSKRNRGILERMLRRGYISRATRNAILYGNPLIVVKIYDYYIDVEIR